MLLFCDSFDHYPSTDLLKKYNVVNNCYISSTVYRTGGYSLTSNQAGFYVSKDVKGTLIPETSDLGEFFFGAHYYLTSLDNQPLLQINGNASNYQLIIEASGSLRLDHVYPGTPYTVVGTYPGLFSLRTWHHIYLAKAEIFVDGKEVIDHNVWTSFYVMPGPSESLRLYPGGVYGNSGYIDNVYFGEWYSSEYGDTFIEDEESGYLHRSWMYNKTYDLLDASVEVLFPDRDYTTEWTPLTGSDNYAMVDEVNQDGDTSYNYSDVYLSADLFGYPTITGSGHIHGIQLVYSAKNEDPTALSGIMWPVVVSPDVVPDTGEEWVPLIPRGQESDIPVTPFVVTDAYKFHTAMMAYKCEPEYEEPGIGLGGWYGGDYIHYSGWTVDSFNASYFGYGLIPSGFQLEYGGYWQ